jgi:hypothetical protein
VKYAACALLLVISVPMRAGADIFEQGDPADAVLRKALAEDREAFYVSTPGLELKPVQERVSSLKSLASDGPGRPRGLRDMDKAFDLFLVEQLKKDRAYKGLVAPAHPLLLLEYSSPVMADIVKHYRMSAYERLAIEEGRLAQIEGATQGRGERLSRLSELGCLKANESRGLVEAMRLCQKSSRSFDALSDVAGGVSLSDGRRSIHVITQALQRLGLDKARIDRIVAMTGEKIISADAQEDRLPETTFEGKVIHERDVFLGQWRQALKLLRSSDRLSVAKLEGLSLPGVAVTQAVVEDILLLEPAARELLILKLSSMQAFFAAQRSYWNAAKLLSVCAGDPGLPEEFRRIVQEKKDSLEQHVPGEDKGRDILTAYKEALAVSSRAADMARARLEQRSKDDGISPEKGLLLNF